MRICYPHTSKTVGWYSLFWYSEIVVLYHFVSPAGGSFSQTWRNGELTGEGETLVGCKESLRCLPFRGNLAVVADKCLIRSVFALVKPERDFRILSGYFVFD